MRRALIAILAVLALPLAMVAPAGAQEELGFEINPTAGSPGDVVTGLVDPADVAEHCTTELEAFQARFAEVLEGPFNSPNFEGGELFDRFYPGGMIVFENLDQTAYSLTVFVLSGLAGALIGDEPAAEALPQTFVLTFADIETQEPVGERSTFDPNTGFGQVTVPDVEPGLWAVAAACVGPTLDLDILEAGIRASGAFLQEIGFPIGDLLGPEQIAFMQAFLGSEATGLELLTEFLGEVGPTLLEPIMVPDAQGTQTFCVDCEPPPSQNLLDQFCGVLPGVQAVPDRLAELFGGVDINDPSTFPSVDSIEAFVNEVSALLEQGDTSVPPTVQPQWTIATAELRELVFGLTAVGFDFALLVDLSPEDADRILEVASGAGPPDPAFDAAVEVLTAFFVENCVPPGAEAAPAEAPPAAPTRAVARFTG